MRHRPVWRTLSLLLLLPALAGCLQLNSSVIIDEHGGGSAQLSFSAPASVIESLAEMRNLDSHSQFGRMGNLASIITKEEFESCVKEHGIELKSFERKTDSDPVTLDVQFDFKDLEGFSRAWIALFPLLGEQEKNGFGFVPDGDGNYALKAKSYDFRPCRAAMEDLGSGEALQEMGPEQMQQFKIFQQLSARAAELKAVMKIVVPGDIVSSNAPSVEGRTSTWIITQKDLMPQFEGSASRNPMPQPEIIFSGKGLSIPTD